MTTERQPITLYGLNSPNVVKITLMLEELNLPYTLRHVAVFKGEQFTPEFLRMNPLGKVPVLVDPQLDRPLAESGAILIYLAERYGGFLPTQSGDRYEVLQWLMVQMSSIGPMLGQYTHFSLLPAGSEPYAHGRYGAIARKLYALLNERFAGREWIAGSEYSIADIATYPWADYLERHRLSPDDYPTMVKWRAKIASRPAAVRAKARMHEAFTEVSTQTIQSASSADLDRFFGRTQDMPAQDFTAVQRMR